MNNRNLLLKSFFAMAALIGAGINGKAQTTTFTYTGGVQTYTVPAAVYSINVDAYGAQGGSAGGKGGRAQATLSVTPGDVLNIYVGGQGAPFASNAPGGFNGGGNAGTCTTQWKGAGGGGASDIRMGGTALINRVIVAGGGGGTQQINSTTNGGLGGGLIGGNVASNSNGCIATWATGGTQAAGGNTSTSGTSCCMFTPIPSNNGSFGQGGNGAGPALSCNQGDGGGGGGGGFYGGGAGGDYTAGAGGSSYSCSCANTVTHTQGVQSGNGQILITPNVTAVGNALNFDGTSTYINCGNFLTASYTKEAWVYITNLGLSNNIISGGADGQHTLWASSANGNKLAAGHNGAWTQVMDATPLLANTWYHVAVTYDAPSTTMKLYKNGVLVATNAAVPAYTGGNYVRIGSYTPGANLYGGNIGEARIWNRALCQGEIQNYMNCIIPSNGAGLIANYQFAEGTAFAANTAVTTLIDASGNSNTGTLVNFALTGNTSNWIAPGPPDCGTYMLFSNTPVTTTTQTNVSCNGGSNGSATITPSAPGTFTYAWAPSGGTAATASGLAPGTYTCTVTNACGGVATPTVVITQPAALTASVTAQSNVSCNGGSNGSATVTTTGGTNPYTYSWSPSGGTSATASGLTPGTYTCTISDSHGCAVAPVTATITQPTALASTSVQTNVACNGASTGSITVTSSGGTGAYTYSWSPSGGTGATASGLAAGTYTCTITDANGCTHAQTATITQPTAITSSITTQTNVTCNGGSNGSATITASGGTGGLTYTWTPSGGNAATASGLTAGTYTCTITDANNCTHAQIVTITQPGPVVVTITETSTGACNGGHDTLTAHGAVTYVWTPATGLNSTTTATVIATVTSTITYTVTGTNGAGCTGTATVTVNLNPNPATPVITAAGNTLSTSATGVTYQWYLNGTPIGGATSQNYTATVSGNYTVVVTNPFGCTATSAIYALTVTGISSLSSGEDMQFFPNPSMSDVTFELTNRGQHTELYLFDMVGQQVKAIQINDTHTIIHHNELAEGVYIYRVIRDGVLIGTGRLVMQK